MRKSISRRGEDGMAMLVGLVFVSLALMITGLISVQLMSQGRQVAVYQDVNATYQALDNANELARIDIEYGGDGIIGLDDWTPDYDSEGRIVLPALDAAGVEPVEMEVMTTYGGDITTTMQFIAYTVDWQNDGADTNGNGVADPDPTEVGLYTVHAKAEVSMLGGQAFVHEMESPIRVKDIQMASAPFDVAALVNEVQFAQVADAALSSYAVLPALLNGQVNGSYDNGGITIQRETEVVHRATAISVWGNAIFGGDAGVGALINGNVSVCGGVHILGENVLEGAPVVDVLEMSGTSFIHNNYDTGAGSVASDRMWESIPDLEQVLVNGIMVDTLNANLRVKNGSVSLGGNAEIGQPNDNSNDMKEYMDGVYVSDGFDDTTRVHSDNGTDEAYDLGNKLSFPMLDDEWRDPDTKQPLADPTNGNGPGGNYTHQDHFTEVLVGDPNNAADGILEGNLTLNVGDCNDDAFDGSLKASEATGLDSPVDNHFEIASEVDGIQFGNIADATLSATTVIMPNLLQGPPGGGGPCEGNFYYRVDVNGNVTLKHGLDAADLSAFDDPSTFDDTDDYLIWNAEEGTLEAGGQIVLEGNLTFTGGNGDVINYTGRAALMVVDGTDAGETPNTLKGNIKISTDLLNANSDGSWDKQSFPENHFLGLMADEDIWIGDGAHREVMGGFYAEDLVKMDKQNQVMGTIVCSQFSIGNQVPNIYQVPSLPSFLPTGMIGAIPISVLQVQSWREVSISDQGNG